MLSEVEGLYDRVAIVTAGRIVVDDDLESLRGRAGRLVTIRWRSEPERSALPDFLELDEVRGSLWTCGLDAPAPRLLDWLQNRPVEDLTIGPPDLDRLFLRYYREREDPA